MANLLYVDNSNVWIEGMHVAAYTAGMTKDVWSAVTTNTCDHSWNIDFGKLFQFAGGDSKDVKRAALFGSKPPKNDSLWAAAHRNGFEVVTFDRNVVDKEKKIDTAIVTEMIKDSYELYEPGDEFTLVAGDSDYVPPIEALRKRNIPVHVVFWAHASKEIKAVATKFIPLDQHLKHLKK